MPLLLCLEDLCFPCPREVCTFHRQVLFCLQTSFIQPPQAIYPMAGMPSCSACCQASTQDMATQYAAREDDCRTSAGHAMTNSGHGTKLESLTCFVTVCTGYSIHVCLKHVKDSSTTQSAQPNTFWHLNTTNCILASSQKGFCMFGKSWEFLL